AIGCYFLLKTVLWDFQTVDEQLAAIEAARAIPDEENAAIIYNQLLENYDESLLSPDFMDDDLDYLTLREPWLSKDYPELAEWLKDRQDIISTLLQASKKEKCRFPIFTNLQEMIVQMDMVHAMRIWARLLVRAANNDIAEGRIDAFIQKYHCLIQMANHLCQQPSMINYLVGFAVEALAMERMKTFILEGDVSEKNLKTIESAIPQTKDNWAEVSPKIMEFETLFEKKHAGFFYRLKRLWRDFSEEDSFDRFHEIYLRLIANHCGSRILIALRRYKNKNGRWPETLDGIKNLVPEEILVDPMNGGSFAYKLTEENFTLYSKGKNNIDEDGKYKRRYGETSEGDDWPIWPTSSRKTKNEKADALQSNAEKDGVK
ncbi:MAG: hypothetical protein OEW48_21180, partial [Phycisphaerae bacterium]|nr:hypothetical protein [Phycisphaerae bacterium]